MFILTKLQLVISHFDFSERFLFYFMSTYFLLGFPGGSDGRESAYSVGDLGSIPGLGRSPRGGHANPLQYSCLENPHRESSLADCSPCGRKELDPLERLRHTHKGLRTQ